MKVVEYIDANGEHQTISDPKHLRVAAGCFGLLGIVTHLTFEPHPMIYAVMKPTKTPISLAIPPLDTSEISPALLKDPAPTKEDFERARKDFENRATNDYYSEWFWFTYQTTSWTNTWNPVEDGSGATEHPSPEGVFLQWLSQWIGGWFSQTYFFQHIPPHWQAQFLAISGMATLPPTTFENPDVTIKTSLPDALHFQRGVRFPLLS